MALAQNLQSISHQATATGRARSSASTILIAEDNADSREVMEMLLRLKGYQVVVAENGFEAVELALSVYPDLILLDFELPGRNGLSVVRSLRAAPYFLQTPVVILSGHDPARYEQTALEAGCNAYLVKPVDFDNLEHFLDEMIASTVPVRKAG